MDKILCFVPLKVGGVYLPGLPHCAPGKSSEALTGVLGGAMLQVGIL